MAGRAMSENEQTAWEAERRDFAADERDELAAERDAAADIRDDIADERDRLVDEREAALDARELQIDDRARALGVPPAHTDEEVSLEALQRANAKTLREAAHQQRDERSVERMAEDVAREFLKKRRT